MCHVDFLAVLCLCSFLAFVAKYRIFEKRNPTRMSYKRDNICLDLYRKFVKDSPLLDEDKSFFYDVFFEELEIRLLGKVRVGFPRVHKRSIAQTA